MVHTCGEPDRPARLSARPGAICARGAPCLACPALGTGAGAAHQLRPRLLRVAGWDLPIIWHAGSRRGLALWVVSY
eukprot:SAG22_NODE_1041_length_5885_cov_9.278776_4_plen_76_part_00